MHITIRELIEALESAAETFGDTTAVAVAVQPSYQLTVALSGVTVIEGEGVEDAVLWLSCSSHAPDGMDAYAPAAAFDNDFL